MGDRDRALDFIPSQAKIDAARAANKQASEKAQVVRKKERETTRTKAITDAAALIKKHEIKEQEISDTINPDAKSKRATEQTANLEGCSDEELARYSGDLAEDVGKAMSEEAAAILAKREADEKRDSVAPNES